MDGLAAAEGNSCDALGSEDSAATVAAEGTGREAFCTASPSTRHRAFGGVNGLTFSGDIPSDNGSEDSVDSGASVGATVVLCTSTESHEQGTLIGWMHCASC